MSAECCLIFHVVLCFTSILHLTLSSDCRLSKGSHKCKGWVSPHIGFGHRCSFAQPPLPKHVHIAYLTLDITHYKLNIAYCILDTGYCFLDTKHSHQPILSNGWVSNIYTSQHTMLYTQHMQLWVLHDLQCEFSRVEWVQSYIGFGQTDNLASPALSDICIHS